jgi:UDP-N-acetylglucosamine acyltransferase
MLTILSPQARKQLRPCHHARIMKTPAASPVTGSHACLTHDRANATESALPTIHPTAIVDSRAILADDVIVGPYCTIVGAVTIGPGTKLINNVSIRGPLTLGARNVVYPFACLGFDPQDRKFSPEKDGAGTIIGDDNILRESVTIHRATRDVPTTVGNGNYLMVNAHVAHDCLVGNKVTLVNGALLGGHVTIFDNVIISGNSAVHQFCRVGRMAIISAAEAVNKDVPPFCMVYHTRLVGGLNRVGLRRAGLRDHIKPLEQAFDILYKRNLPNQKAASLILEELGHDPLCIEMAQFIQQSKTGMSQYVAKHVFLNRKTDDD